MSANQFGNLFSVSTFGESHGQGLGCVIDGCPAGVPWNGDRLQAWMNRRRPGVDPVGSQRGEPDKVEVLSGVFENRTLGSPIAMMVRNVDARSTDYSREKVKARPGHAADLWQEKFGHSDFRGSGRASGRETVARVMAGAVAEMVVRRRYPNAKVTGFVSQLGPWKVGEKGRATFLASTDDWPADKFPARLPDQIQSQAVLEGLTAARTKGESYGGICEVILKGFPAGFGQPVFHKLKSDLAMAMMSVGATAGVDFGDGFDSTELLGSAFHGAEQLYGGLRGGISTGDDIQLRVAFKPASTLGKMATEGRHDPAILPRAVPVLEAMAWMTIADHLLWQRLDRIS